MLYKQRWLSVSWTKIEYLLVQKNTTEKDGLYALFSMRYTNSPIHDFTTWKRRIVIKIVNFFHEFYQSLYRKFSKENNAFVSSPQFAILQSRYHAQAHAKIIICHSVMFLLIHNMKYPIMYFIARTAYSS